MVNVLGNSQKDLAHVLDEGDLNDLLYLDILKSINKISHQRLL